MMTSQGCGGDEMPTVSGLEKGHSSQTLAMVLIFFVISTDASVWELDETNGIDRKSWGFCCPYNSK